MFFLFFEVCIKVQYLKKNIGVLLTLTWGGKVVYSKEVSGLLSLIHVTLIQLSDTINSI